jgi:hypothetical protein
MNLSQTHTSGFRARMRTVLENIDKTICGNARVSDSHRSDAVYQGTTLVGSYGGGANEALAPEVLFQVSKNSRRRARLQPCRTRSVARRLQPLGTLFET